jgi:hypothetical protein
VDWCLSIIAWSLLIALLLMASASMAALFSCAAVWIALIHCHSLPTTGRPNRLLSTPAAKSSWHGLKYRVQVEVFSQNLVMPGLALAEKLALVMFRNLVRS